MEKIQHHPPFYLTLFAYNVHGIHCLNEMMWGIELFKCCECELCTQIDVQEEKQHKISTRTHLLYKGFYFRQVWDKNQKSYRSFGGNLSDFIWILTHLKDHADFFSTQKNFFNK